MPQWAMTLLVILAVGVGIFIFVMGIFALFAKFFRKVEQGKALIVNKLKAEPDVTFAGMLVLPIIHKAEVMHISVKTIEIDRRGQEGLICRDNIRADIKVTFFVRVNKTREDVLKVAQSIGCARASEQATLEELFSAKFSEALKTVGKLLDFEDLYMKRQDFKDQIIETIGEDLNGYVLDDAAIDYLEQTPLGAMDTKNILDAQGIKKITEITTQQNVLTNDLKQTERKEITRQNVEADEAVFELERQRADAESKQQREIQSVQAREQAETQKVQAEERARAQRAAIKAEEEVLIDNENKQRQVEVAQKNRERVVGIEQERVEKDRMLEQITRERETELSRIDKEKLLEVEKKHIADVIRDRIAVEKNVAEEEERIKDLRAVADATRKKDVIRLGAEAQADEKLIMEIKAAEASEEVAKFQAREVIVEANAKLESSDKEAAAKIRLAEGVQAEQAASGLAEVKVKEADAVAVEKQGLAHVRVKEADADAIEKVGLAEVAVKEANAAAIQKEGLAEAEVIREKMLAEAKGEEQQGLADVTVREADAVAVEKLGLAEALSIEKKLAAEATGLAEKAEAMKALDGVGREHEEFRIELEKDKEVELAAIDVRKDIAMAQAEILSKAFDNAKLNIVGGDGEFFERFVKAVTFGQSVDAGVANSETIQQVIKDYLGGERSLPEDLKQVLSRPALSSEGVQRLTVSAVLGKLMLGVDEGDRAKIQSLILKAKELGIDELAGK